MRGVTATLLRNGTVYSPADPFATAMLVVGDQVAWVGQEGAAEAHADAVDAVVDLCGALVTPAFVDAHVHTTETGLALDGVDLAGTVCLAEALDRVAAHARQRPGRMLLGHGWDEDRWPERRPPTAAELDRAAGGAVVYLSRADVHSAAVSTALLAAAPQVTRADGWEGDGLVRRRAHDLARRFTRDRLTAGERRAAQLATLRRAAALGIAVVHEISAPHINPAADLAALRELAAEEPVCEVVPYWGELAALDEAAALGVVGLAGDLCLDGTIGSRTAALDAPYVDAPHTHGHLYVEPDAVVDHVVACTRAGLQAGFHAIGDRAIRVAVAAIDRAAEICGAEAVIAARHRLEHVEMIAPDLVPVLARLGVSASVQPVFDALWGGEDGMYVERLGRDRALAMNPFAGMSHAGVTLALGSDSPVTPLGPWAAVRAAAFHRTPGSGLSVRGAFSAHTRGGWRAAGYDEGGVLAPGQPATYAVWDVPADLVVQAPDERVAAWSTDPRSGVPGLPDLSPDAPLPTCLATVSRGRVIHGRLDD